jgi:hypothetical protein
VVGKLICDPNNDTVCKEARLLKLEVMVGLAEGANIRATVWRAEQPLNRLPNAVVVIVPIVTDCSAEQPLRAFWGRVTVGLLIITDCSAEQPLRAFWERVTVELLIVTEVRAVKGAVKAGIV